MGAIPSHNDLSGLQGGAATQYYHLTSTAYTDLTDGGTCTSHNHDTYYFKKKLFTAVGGTAQSSMPVKLNVSGVLNTSLLNSDLVDHGDCLMHYHLYDASGPRITPVDKYHYMGTDDVNGSWRYGPANGTKYVHQYRKTGTWTTYHACTAS
jgi:hypothetical protein